MKKNSIESIYEELYKQNVAFSSIYHMKKIAEENKNRVEEWKRQQKQTEWEEWLEIDDAQRYREHESENKDWK